MEENINNAIEWLKAQPIKGCISGSCLLGYFEGQDVDIFLYNEDSFRELFYAMWHNPMFLILDPVEKWKADQFRKGHFNNKYKTGITTLKFIYNTCISVNIIMKRNATNIFAVLSSFDLDIIARGYDVESGRMLDLSEPGNIDNKVTTWNRWNTHFYDPELWEMNRILRQLERVFKYHKRGYNTDDVVYKYIELIDNIQSLKDIFNSKTYSEKLKINKNNTRIMKKICLQWLDTHEITDKELELLRIKIREM